ncbi:MULTISPECIES: hypothetical protein [unclassified Synechococcus]|uniref:hypothetical protein n=1 Tax=unclassified Synechococcus TaxID=2626047 RepID=UPI0039AF3AB0
METEKESVAQGSPKKRGSKDKLVAVGIAPMGVISIGIAPMGVLCIGIIPMGIIGLGIVSMGAITASVIGMGLFSVGYNTMGVVTAGPLSMSRINIWGPKMKMPHMHHGHEIMHEAAHKNSYVIYDDEDMARTSAKMMGCTTIHRVGNYWAPCKAPGKTN